MISTSSALVRIFVLLALMQTSLGSCSDELASNPDDKSLSEDGRELTLRYCSRCHLPVTPDLLDKDSWMNHVLPAMAPGLGIKVWHENQYYPAPPQYDSAISFENWMKIVAYFKKAAPEQLALPDPPLPRVNDWFVFTLKKPRREDLSTASTTLVAIDTISGCIYSSNADNDLLEWNIQLQASLVCKLPSPAVHAGFTKSFDGQEKGVFTCIGTMEAIDAPRGEVLQMNLPHQTTILVDTFAKNLPRPVQSVAEDFNKDGLMDRVVCGFGHNAGGLYLLSQASERTFRKAVIKEAPGATQAITGDFNHDGWPDIMCLFAHADEGIWLFLNDHKGGFISSNLLRFLPLAGSTSFQLVDFNKDGLPDILYTSGDNSDYSRILKPFHGVYIFINQGNFRFKQEYFYPVNGCTKAIAADFDQDGDLDIAAIAFFADLKNNPSEKFICFEQDKPLHFIPHALPIQSSGRWICMDVNDYDHDGDPDIVLGSYSKGLINQDSLKPDWNTQLPLIVLENTHRGKQR